MAIAKKDQLQLLRNALDRMHFHQTVTGNTAAINAITLNMIAFAEQMNKAEAMEGVKQSAKATEEAFKLLETLP